MIYNGMAMTAPMNGSISRRNRKVPPAFTARVYAVVAGIPRGKVMTYREVARAAGRPNAYRAVGNIMHNNPDMKRVPCHRVVRSDGTVGGYARGAARKVALLRREGAL